MRRLVIVTFSFLALSLGGCTLTTASGTATLGTGTGALSAEESGGADQCAPNQRWDGQCCRHKGQGRGARQHDAPNCRN
jgi:hypothetical protein